MGKPGIMIYYDTLEAICMMPAEDGHQLMQAILCYSRDGIEPVLEGPLAIAWAFVKPKLDRDTQAYREKSLSRQYAVYCRETKRRGEMPMERGKWDQLMVKRQTMLTDHGGQTDMVTGLAHATDEDAPINLYSLVSLSRYQIDMLLTKMGVDTLQLYIDRLVSLIRSGRLTNRDHYTVILQWWTQDYMQQ